MWWSGNNYGKGGIGILVKAKICEKVIKIQKKVSVVTIVVVFGEKVMRIICVYGSWVRRSDG